MSVTNEYNPSLPVDCERFPDVPRLVNTTWAPTITAPDESVTVPATDPYVLCPCTREDDKKAGTSKRTNVWNLRANIYTPAGWSTFRQPLLLVTVKDRHRLPLQLDLHAFCGAELEDFKAKGGRQ